MWVCWVLSSSAQHNMLARHGTYSTHSSCTSHTCYVCAGTVLAVHSTTCWPGKAHIHTPHVTSVCRYQWVLSSSAQLQLPGHTVIHAHSVLHVTCVQVPEVAVLSTINSQAHSDTCTLSYYSVACYVCVQASGSAQHNCQAHNALLDPHMTYMLHVCAGTSGCCLAVHSRTVWWTRGQSARAISWLSPPHLTASGSVSAMSRGWPHLQRGWSQNRRRSLPLGSEYSRWEY